ncbi:MAG: asparagine synthase (glutamine-hydrolyzing), partial [Terriglobales bacterium]
LVHRGPDQQGVWESEHISLGVVRLKIVDLEHGDQPMQDEASGTVIVFNGEIYNHAEVRRELEGLGHVFRSRCDTEVALRAFLQWDTESFHRLRGMFAYAVWSEPGRRLVLVRDRMGIKPLYVYHHGRDLFFASELKGLFVHPEVERTIDLEGLSYFLSLNYVPGPHTLVSGIRKLPPGHWMEWQGGRTSNQPYWRLPMGQPVSRTLDSAKEELDELLKNSVREHLMSDVPLGVWASGGLDSSAILHYAAQASGSQLKTFSVSFLGRSFDESQYFREVAQAYGTDHHELDLNTEADLRGAIDELSYYSDEPSADAGALPVWFLSRLSRQHVTVALSGEGADELLGGYDTYIADDYARTLRGIAPTAGLRLARALLRHWPASDEKISLGYKLKRFVEGSLLSPDEAHAYWNGSFSEAQKREFFAAPEGARVSALFEGLPRAADDPLLRYLAFDQLRYLPDDILYKCDRMSMAHSLEVRPPFLDHRIVEFAASLPGDLKVRGGKLKIVLRELMQGKLPPAVLRRRKEGFDIPVHQWMRRVLRPLLLDTLTPASAAATGLFRWNVVEKLVRDHLERRADIGYHLWGLLTLFLWMKRWNIQGRPSLSRSQEAFNSAIPTI